ncbi:MAG: CpaF family protein [Candidatus Brocadiales bacterium]
MSLRKGARSSSNNNRRVSATPKTDKHEEFFNRLKRSMHRRLVDTMDLSKIASMETDRFRQEVQKALQSFVGTEPGCELLNSTERNNLINEVCHEMLGLGPLEPLFADNSVTDILVNDPKHVFIERNGKIEPTDIVFQDENHLMQIIEKIVTAVGRRIDESSPMVDARLSDGSRVNAVIPPLALDGPALSIRRFGSQPLTVKNLVQFNTITKEILALLDAAVKAKMNILISGGTGSGKTTLLNILTSYIPNNERIITIEDSAELQLQQSHVVRLEMRPPNVEGRGEVTQRDLLRNSLRMRPNRIIIGEVRGAEAIDMLQAMNTGHEGSLSTIHANSPRDALTRLEVMCAMSGFEMPMQAIRYYISSAINIVIQVSRLTDGSRKVVSISEITGMEGQIITMQDIFRFSASGGSVTGKIRGEFRATGVMPRFLDRIKAAGIDVPVSDEIFRSSQ